MHVGFLYESNHFRVPSTARVSSQLSTTTIDNLNNPSMSTLATTELLTHLKSLYPLRDVARGTNAVLRNPWYIVSAVAYGSSNRPEAVPIVFQHALDDLRQAQAEQQKPAEVARQEQLQLARRMREAILKGGMLCGYSRVNLGLAHAEQTSMLTLSCTGNQRSYFPT